MALRARWHWPCAPFVPKQAQQTQRSSHAALACNLSRKLGQRPSALLARKRVGAIRAVEAGACGGMHEKRANAKKGSVPAHGRRGCSAAWTCSGAPLVQLLCCLGMAAGRGAQQCSAGQEAASAAIRATAAGPPAETSRMVPHTASSSGLAGSPPPYCASSSRVSFSGGTICKTDRKVPSEMIRVACTAANVLASWRRGRHGSRRMAGHGLAGCPPQVRCTECSSASRQACKGRQCAPQRSDLARQRGAAPGSLPGPAAYAC